MPLENSSSTDVVENSPDAIFGRFVVSQMLGSNAFGLDEITFGESDETPDLVSTIVNLLVTLLETQQPGLMAELEAGLQAEDLGRI